MNHIPFVCEHEKRDECVCHIRACVRLDRPAYCQQSPHSEKNIQHGLSFLLEESSESRCWIWGFSPNHCLVF